MDMRKYLIAAAMAGAAVSTPTIAAPGPTKAATGRALLLLPLKLTKIKDLDFGTVIKSSTYGTVALDANTGARTFAGGVTGLSIPGQPAYFGGAGSSGELVVVVITPPTKLNDGNGHTVDVIAMSLDNGNNPLRIVDPVTKTFFVGVGAVLGIAANQADGTYTNTFQVTANYL